MHGLGKALNVLVILAAMACIVLTAKVIDVRGGWIRAADALRDQNEADQAELETLRRQVDQARADLEQTLVTWDTYWSPIDVQPSPQQGTVATNLGTNLGFGNRQDAAPEMVYAFQLQQDGTSVYVGAFSAASVQENSSTLQFEEQARPDEGQRWQAGQWRFRKLIPSQYPARFGKLRSDLVISDELLSAKQDNVVIQDRLIQQSEDQLKQRLLELTGEEMAGVPGLVQLIAQEEEQRDQILEEVDRLRRSVKDHYEQLQALRAKNVELTRQLDAPVTAKLPAAVQTATSLSE